MTERNIHDRDELWIESDGQSRVLDYNKVQLELNRLAAENERLRAALDLFVNFCTYRVAREINPRGYAWRGEKDFDYARSEALKALGGASEQKARPEDFASDNGFC